MSRPTLAGLLPIQTTGHFGNMHLLLYIAARLDRYHDEPKTAGPRAVLPTRTGTVTSKDILVPRMCNT